jgi:protein SCO1
MKSPTVSNRLVPLSRALCLLCAVLLLNLARDNAGFAQTRPTGSLPVDVGIEQKLDEQVPGNLSFTDEAGATVYLRDYFGKKPLVLALVYYECPMLCTLVLNGMLHSFQNMALEPGVDYDVVTVSFDPREKPELAAAKKRVYLTLLNRKEAWNGWHFLTGEEKNIRQLANSVGFKYAWDAENKQYSHATGIIVLTPEGRVSRYFYGIDYPARDLRLGLVEASAGKIGSPLDQVLLLCYHYDPVSGKYGFIITRSLQLGGALVVLALTGMVVFFVRHARSNPQGPPFEA